MSDIVGAGGDRLARPGQILVGVAGWSFPDWKGLVYPRESNLNKLQYLTQFFDTVEVNTSFYAIPTRRLVDGWVKSVSQNPAFLFSVKLYKQLTHGEDVQHGKPEIIPATVEAFKTALQPMLEGKRLGALLLQFPYRFHYEPKNLDYLLRLFETFREYPLVLEVRHKSFAQEPFYAFLEKQGVAFANIDQPEVSYSLPSTNVFTTSRLAYLRFHGRNSEAWFAAEAGRDDRYNYNYSSEELDLYLGMVKEFRERAGTLYVIFNNHYRGSEVKNALEFIHKMSGKKVRVMPKLLKAYPELQRIALPPGPEESDIQPGENYRLFGSG